MAMSFNNLKILVEVVNNQNNITLTAQKLYISQPSVSKAIKNIEEELQVKIFNRDKKTGLTLTPIGEKILLHVRTLLHEEEQIIQIAQDENHMLGGILRIATIPLHTYPYIGRAIKIFHDHYPHVDIQYHEVTTKQVKEMVASYQVDLGITISPFDEFETAPLYDDEMIAFTKEKLPINIFDFKNYTSPIKVCRSGLEVMQPLLEKAHLFNEKQFDVYSSPMTVKVFVDEGLGLGIVSKSFIEHLDDYYLYTLQPPISSECAIIYHHYDDLTYAAREFIKIVNTLKGSN